MLINEKANKLAILLTFFFSKSRREYKQIPIGIFIQRDQNFPTIVHNTYFLVSFRIIKSEDQ